MKKKIGAALTALTLCLGIGVALAAPAQASTRIGPFSYRSACVSSMNSYVTYGGAYVISNGCFSTHSSGNAAPWYFTIA